jgi:signal transduction histidine kinase
VSLERDILTSFRAGVLAIGIDGSVVYLNTIGRKILEGASIREGENIHARAGENAFFRVLAESLSMNYLPTRLEVDLPLRGGEHQYLGFTLAELKNGERRSGICAFFKDLTHVEMAEESENLNRRLLLLGQMAAGLAHEIRNPIASIGVHCGILKNHLPENEKFQTSVGMIATEVSKVDFIIRECLTFVRPAELDIRNIDVEKMVREVLVRVASVFPGARFSLKSAAPLPSFAEGDKVLLEQAITNILSNAAEASGSGGEIEVSLGLVRHFSDLLKVNRMAETILPGYTDSEKEFVKISIRDNGPGVPEEIGEKIFVPFFTTKKTGTGIGLPMAQKIIHSHGGILDLRSSPGEGAEFIIQIPVRQKVGS